MWILKSIGLIKSEDVTCKKIQENISLSPRKYEKYTTLGLIDINWFKI